MTITSSSNYRNKTLSSITLKNTKITNVEFESCTFKNCNFQETIFSNCVFKDITYINCNCTLVEVEESTIETVKFKNSKATGINWTKMKKNKLFQPSLQFLECKIDFSNFAELNIKHFKAIKSSVKKVNFVHTHLIESDFSKSDLTGTQFLHTNLTKSNFVDTKNYTLDFRCNEIKKATFSFPEVMRVLQPLDIYVDNI